MLMLVLGVLRCGGSDVAEAPEQTRAIVAAIRPGVSAVVGGKASPLGARLRLATGDRVVTDDSGRASVRLDTGALLVLDGSSEVEIRDDGALIAKGRAWVDAEEGAQARLETPQGVITARAAGLGVAVGRQGTSVYVAQGEALYAVGSKRGLVRSGQSATLTARDARVVNERLWDDWTGGLAIPGPREGTSEGVGEIYARLPDQLGEARWPLVIRTLDVRVTIRKDLAVTEVDQVFFNPASDTVEGLYRIRVPRGALLQRFAVDRDGQLVDSIVKEKHLARQNYDQQVYQGSTEDPALLEWEAADQYRARIYPIAPGAARRIVIRYAEWIGSGTARRTYRYPIGKGPRVQEMSLEVDLSEAGAKSIRAGLGARKVGDRVVLYQSDFQPRADFYLDLEGALPATGTAVAYRAEHHPAAGPQNADPDESDYFFAQLFPGTEGLSAPESLDLVLLVDMSAGTDATRLELGRTVVESILATLDEKDRVSVVAADVGMHAIADRPTRLLAADDGHKEAILDALAREPAGGATDLGTALADAAALLDRERPGAVVYIGDALPTVGELDLPALGKRLSRLPRPPRLYGVAVGSQAQLDLLEGLTRNAGLALRVEAKRDAAEVAMQILEHVSRPLCTGLTVDVGSGVDRVYPRSAADLVAGEPFTVIGRIRDKVPGEIVVRGRRAGRAFEERLKVTTSTIEDASDLRLRWASERLHQLLAEGGGRESIVEVGTRYGLLTPFTSFYVPSRTDLDNDPEIRRMLDLRREEERRGGWQSAVPRPAGGTAFGCEMRSPDMGAAPPQFMASPGSPPVPPPLPSSTPVTAAPPAAEEAQARQANEEGRMAHRGPADDDGLGLQGFGRGGGGTGEGTIGLGPMGARGDVGGANVPPATTLVPTEDAERTRSLGYAGPAQREDARDEDRSVGWGSRSGGGQAPPAQPAAPAPEPARDFAARLAENAPARPPAARPLATKSAPAGASVVVDGRLSKGAHEIRLRSSAQSQIIASLGDSSAVADLLQAGEAGNDSLELDELTSTTEAEGAHFEQSARVAIVGIALHAARRCSNASRQRLGVGAAPGRARLQSRPGLDGALGVFRQARRNCELPGWRDRRALLTLMLDGAGGAQEMVDLFNAFDGDWGVQSFLRREILGRVRTAGELRIVHQGLGERGGVDWTAVEDLLKRATTREAKIAAARDLLRRWPNDLRLSIRLFGLFEEAGELREARRLADVIRADPYADAQARTLVGEFFLRQRDEKAAKRAFSEIVEFAPFDPYARRWLGDLYRAYGWWEDAYRQYETLQVLTPDDDGVLLLLAAAAAGAGRTDEALRLEGRVASSAEPGMQTGNARWATLLSGLRLAELRTEARTAGGADVEAKLAKLVARANRSGTLREAGAFRAILTWSHPDAGVELWTSFPQGQLGRPEDLGSQYGLESWNVQELSPGRMRLEIRQSDDPGLRTVKARLVLVWNEGQATERMEEQELVFDRAHRVYAFTADGAGKSAGTPAWTPAAEVQP
ncbi:MAG: VWA domain-containing protein [Deltaproteobacteria bacterium]|nr:VWA domain-containing protein [Deltaproteobacteria bacterium]